MGAGADMARGRRLVGGRDEFVLLVQFLWSMGREMMLKGDRGMA